MTTTVSNAHEEISELLLSLNEVVSAGDAEATSLPWSDDAFSGKVLKSHAGQRFVMPSARRYAVPQRTLDVQVPTLIDWMGFRPGSKVFDGACGNGHLLGTFVWRGSIVTGIDVAPAGVREAWRYGVGTPCTYFESDFLSAELPDEAFDIGLFMNNQIGFRDADERHEVLTKLRRLLRPGAPLVIEILDPAHAPRQPERHWRAGKDVWGPGQHLTILQCEQQASGDALVSSQYVLDCETGRTEAYRESEQLIAPAELEEQLGDAGFSSVDKHAGWDGRLGDFGAGRIVMIAR